MLPLHRYPFTECSVLRDAVWACEHHSGTIRKLLVSALDDAGPFIAQHERRFCPWMVSRENRVIERSDTGGGHPHQDASIRHRWLGNVREFQILIAAECLCYNRAHLLILASLTFTLPHAVSPLGSSESDASSVKANLLDDGVVDTLGSVGATSGVYISINASDSARIPSRSTSPSCPSRTLSTKRVMHGDGIDFSSTGGRQHRGTAEFHRASRYSLGGRSPPLP